MWMSLKNKIKEVSIENIVLLIIVPLSWLGFGSYMAGVLTIGFIFSLFFKYKRELIFKDRVLIILLLIFTINNVISSLLSIDRLISTLLSLLWFIVILIPMAYVRFSLNEKSEFYIKMIVPIGIYVAFIIVAYIIGKFLYSTITHNVLRDQRYTFYFLGKQSTTLMLIVCAGIGYGWLLQKEERKYLWFGFFYLLLCSFGVALAGDRGGFVAFFVLILILLRYDYKKLIIFIVILGIAGYFSMIKVGFFIRFKYLLDSIFVRGARRRLIDVGHIAVFRAAWEMIKDHWLMGVGTNNFSSFIRQYGNHKGYAYAHNFILQFWAENGLFGMISGLSIITLVIYRWLKSYRLYKYKYIAYGIGASYISLLVADLTAGSMWSISDALQYWFLAGTISGIYFIVKNEKDKISSEAN